MIAGIERTVSVSLQSVVPTAAAASFVGWFEILRTVTALWLLIGNHL